jgi:NAD(P)H-dependent FMN reductase
MGQGSDTTKHLSMAPVALNGLARFEWINRRWIDLAEFDLRSYPRSEDDPVVAWMREEFEAADGVIVACPVYNWGAAGSLTNFFHYVLDSRTEGVTVPSSFWVEPGRYDHT